MEQNKVFKRYNLSFPEFNSVSSIELSKNVKKYKNAIKKDLSLHNETSNISGKDGIHEGISFYEILKICEYFFSKLYRLYYIEEEFKNSLINKLSESIYQSRDILIQLRLYYLHFIDEDFVYKLSYKLYKMNIKNIIDPIHYFQILKYMIKSTKINLETKTELWNEFENIFILVDHIRLNREIADIFLLFGNENRGHELLEQVRILEVPILQRNVFQGDIKEDIIKIKSIYSDSQNVHNSEINKSVISVAYHLLLEGQGNLKFEEIEEIKEYLQEIIKNNDKINSPIHSLNIFFDRIFTDTSQFIYKDKNHIEKFNLFSIFCNLWGYIKNHKHKDELEIRLIEQIEEMVDYCSTGHLARLINVIQGYTHDEKLIVKMSSRERYKSIISYHLSKILEKAPEKIIDNIIEEDNSLYINFVIENIKSLFSEIDNEEDIENIIKILNEYVPYTNGKWIYKDNIFKVTIPELPQK